MKQKKESVEVAAQVETPAAAEPQNIETPVEAKPTEATAPATPPAVEVPPAEGKQDAPAAVAPTPVEEPKPELSRDEFLKVVDEFGAEIAAQIVKDGGDYTAALKLAYEQTKARLASAMASLAELAAGRAGTPAPVADATKVKKSLFNTGK